MKIEEYISPLPHKCLDKPRDTSQMHIAGPITFRRASKMVLSGKSKKNPFINFGGNRQNMDGKLRQLRLADKGKKLINRDLSGADALVVSMLCKQGPYRELFQNDIKPHTYLALNFFPNEWKKHIEPSYVDQALKTPIKDLRALEYWNKLAKIVKNSDYNPPTQRYYFFGKTAGHAFNYGQQEQRFIDGVFEATEGQVDIPLQEGARWKNIYHNLFPEIQAHFQFGTIAYAKRFGCLRNLFGWPFNLTKDVEKLSGKDLNELYAWAPQSTVAVITLMALVELQSYIEEHDKQWDILNEVHDSILIQAPDSEVEEAAIILGQFMMKELVSPVDGFKFRIKSDCKVGLNYGDKSEDNPFGMEEIKLAA